MKHINILITLILILETTSLFAQTSIDQDKKQVTEVFQLFFNSMRNRDTLTLKTCIHFSHPDSRFFKQFSGNDQQLTGNSASTESGFLKSVSDSNGFIGKCQNEFDNIDVKIDQRYAIVTAHYRCFVEGHSDNKGIYTVQMLKSDKWRIESLTRYAEKIE